MKRLEINPPTSTLNKMEKIEEEPIVHLRYNKKEKKYQMSIPPKIVHPRGYENVKIDEEIQVECPETGTVELLLEQIKIEIKNVISHILRKKGKEVKIENDDIEIYLRRQRMEGYKIIPENLEISSIILQDHTKTRLTIFDKQFKLTANAPQITKLMLPPVIYAQNRICPIKFEGLYIRKKLCEFYWFRSKDAIKWEKIENEYGFSLYVKLEDIGYFLKLSCLPCYNINLEGPYYEVISKKAVLHSPRLPYCPFHRRHLYTKNVLMDER